MRIKIDFCFRIQRRIQPMSLSKYYDKDANQYEIGIDEAGRGPLFGRLYVSGVVLPKGDEFLHGNMKDSKRFSSKKKIKEQAEYIKTHCIAWSVQYIEPDVIDEINIRQAVFRGMHACIRDIMQKIKSLGFQRNTRHSNEFMLLVDGNDFKPFTVYDDTIEELRSFPHETIEGGDNKYTAIAAASILAKVSHDEYIAELCEKYPALIERYGLDKNVGYGTKSHLEGIQEYGITQWHRKTFGQTCRNAKLSTM